MIILVVISAFLTGYFKAQSWKEKRLSTPFYYGSYCVVFSFLPPLFLGSVSWVFGLFHHSIPYLTSALLISSIIGFFLAWRRLSPLLQPRLVVEYVLKSFFWMCAAIAVVITLGVVFSLLFESLRFLRRIPLPDFLFGLTWDPQPFRTGYGMVPLLTGTFLITFIAMGIAGPLGLFSAIYLSEYATPRSRAVIKPLLEILAGIPTVVYGFFAALMVAPFVRDVGASMGLSVASESALACGLVMGVMIIPYISSLSEDVIHALPQALRDGAYGLGATSYEMIRYVLLPAAFPGLMSTFLLAISRAVGETMLVVMAAGLTANLTFNPFHGVTTVTVQIVALLTGDQEFNSSKTLAAFALGFLLFCVTLLLNLFALRIVKKHRKKYGTASA